MNFIENFAIEILRPKNRKCAKFFSNDFLFPVRSFQFNPGSGRHLEIEGIAKS